MTDAASTDKYYELARMDTRALGDAGG